jgi:hypothetical protein
MKTKYITNNSGGDWWLTDEDWHKLEDAGWTVDWVATSENWKTSIGAREVALTGRWLGALATQATRDLPLDLAIAEFEHVTGQDAEAEGCECCGQPHGFYEEDDDE